MPRKYFIGWFALTSLVSILMVLTAATRASEASHAPYLPEGGTFPWFFRYDYVVKDDTGYYGAVISNAASNWSSGLSSQGSSLRTFVWSGQNFLDTWILKSGHFEDAYVSGEQGIPMCSSFSSNPYDPAHTVRAFEQKFGDTWLGRYRYSRVCVNHDAASGATKYFTDIGFQTQINGLSHELGHSFALAHWSDHVSVMQQVCQRDPQTQQCIQPIVWVVTWAYPVQGDDALAVKEYYGW